MYGEQSMVYITGGEYYTCGLLVDTVVTMCFNPTKEEWHQGPDMNLPRSSHAACQYQDTLLVFGGQDKQISPGSIEMYDTEQNVWTLLSGNLPFGNQQFVNVRGSNAAAGEIVVVLGGVTQQDVLKGSSKTQDGRIHDVLQLFDNTSYHFSHCSVPFRLKSSVTAMLQVRPPKRKQVTHQTNLRYAPGEPDQLNAMQS